MPPSRKSSVSGPRLPDAGRCADELLRLFVPAFDSRVDDCLDSECGKLKCPGAGGGPENDADRGDECAVVFVVAGVGSAEGGVGKRVCSVEVGDGS